MVELLADLSDIHITAMYGAISALAAGLSWVAKLFYVDVKKALSDCEERHKEVKKEYEEKIDEAKVESEQHLKSEKIDCEEKLKEHKAVINSLQTQINTLTSNVFEIMKGNNSGIHK